MNSSDHQVELFHSRDFCSKFANVMKIDFLAGEKFNSNFISREILSGAPKNHIVHSPSYFLRGQNRIFFCLFRLGKIELKKEFKKRVRMMRISQSNISHFEVSLPITIQDVHMMAIKSMLCGRKVASVTFLQRTELYCIVTIGHFQIVFTCSIKPKENLKILRRQNVFRQFCSYLNLRIAFATKNFTMERIFICLI